MKQANSITAPFILIAAMLFLLLFQRVFLNLDNVRYTQYAAEYVSDFAGYAGYSGNYVIYNGERYIPERLFTLVFILHFFVFIIPAAFYIKLFKGAGYAKELNARLPEMGHASLLLYGLGALVSGVAFLNSMIYFAGGSLEVRAVVIDSGGNPLHDISATMAFVILPALCEEFLFRSVMLREYEKYGALCACIVSSAAFAALRFSFALFPLYFLAGVILYIIAKASESIVFPVIAHAGYSFFNIYVWTRLSTVLSFEQNQFIFTFSAAVIFIIFMIALLNKTEKIYYYKAYANAPMPESVTAKTPALTALSPTLIAAAIIYFIGVNT